MTLIVRLSVTLVVRVNAWVEASGERDRVIDTDFVRVTLIVRVTVRLPDRVAYLVVGKPDADLVAQGLVLNDVEEHVVCVIEARPDRDRVYVTDFVWLILTV